jgi:hypothetical protein
VPCGIETPFAEPVTMFIQDFTPFLDVNQLSSKNNSLKIFKYVLMEIIHGTSLTLQLHN